MESEAGRVQFELQSQLQDAVVRASARQKPWALRNPVEQPSRMRKKCCYNTEEPGVNMSLVRALGVSREQQFQQNTRPRKSHG